MLQVDGNFTTACRAILRLLGRSSPQASDGDDLKAHLIAAFPDFAGGRVLLDHQKRFLFPVQGQEFGPMVGHPEVDRLAIFGWRKIAFRVHRRTQFKRNPVFIK